MTTTAPPRREWTRLDPPDVVLLVVALLVVDLAVGVAVVVVGGDARCTTFTCRVEGVSITRPLVGLGLAVGATVIPLLWAWWRRRGLRTTAAVQLVVGAVLVVHAVTAVSAADAARRHPAPVPFQPSLRPCAAKTLEGFTCLTYSATPPPEPVGSP